MAVFRAESLAGFQQTGWRDYYRICIVEFGFKSITDPIKFSTVAKIMTIEAACKMKNVDMEAFLKALNEKTEKEV
ncbi:MAG: DUF1858 domain-containing protein [Deferribacterales bacterium]